ncbi:hypothetical protein SG34_032340 [Thalassomonas viridans]|uniref:Uncharacterized protein n=1 Tax=Thalassomonas viridans TaxID=137584 RepID=A0AAF0CD93_9GAMM|nr:hypothetical protein [Thalassomonas viridans]WDE08611.1 hypothetical protein SG34_032340 [Thalassomonas viridans]
MSRITPIVASQLLQTIFMAKADDHSRFSRYSIGDEGLENITVFYIRWVTREKNSEINEQNRASWMNFKDLVATAYSAEVSYEVFQPLTDRIAAGKCLSGYDVRHVQRGLRSFDRRGCVG